VSVVGFSAAGDDDTPDVPRAGLPGPQGGPDTLGSSPDSAYPAGPGGEPGPPPASIGRYKILETLGRGGMGVVYKALDETLGRTVAIKMIRSRFLDDPGQRTRFEREAMAVARLQHPNIVQIYDVIERDGHIFLVLELVEGGSLASHIRGEPMPPRDAAGLVSTLAHAVHFAHTKGIIHRDLKPSNILLRRDGVPKVHDFGLARKDHDEDHDGTLTLPGQPLGTPAYMSPEQAAGKIDQIGTSTDIFSLGVILFELLTGRRPFRAESAAELLYAVIHHDSGPPSRVNGAIPRDLDPICMKCLHKDPAKRYPSAEALAEDLDRFLRGNPIRARPPAVWERLTRRLTRWFSFGK
jgi:serine/threonine-protein kinase